MRVFVSYDYDNDRGLKALLLAWSANTAFDFEFEDVSVDISVNSTEAGPIRRVISQRINDAHVFLCLVGWQTHRSEWVAWEIEKAKELRKRIAAVKVEARFVPPQGLYGCGAEWAQSFTFEGIRNAVYRASTGINYSF